ncbi:MAG: hypothetical protein ACRDH2_08690 [Anaerolineales bacterium]
MTTRKILQIMPAPGWGAAFEEDGEEYVSTLAGWALVQEGEGQAVMGLVAGKQVEFCDDQPGFTGYVHLQEMVFDMFDDEMDDEFDDDEDELGDAPPKRTRLN